MYPVSSAFHQLATADSPVTRCRIYFIPDTVNCTDDNDVQTNGTLLIRNVGDTNSNGRISQNGISFSDLFNADKNVQIGSTVSKPISISFMNQDGALTGFGFGRCKIYIDVWDATNNTWLSCPMGVYIIDVPIKRSALIISASGYDQMQYLNQIADAWWSTLDWENGITVSTLISDIATQCGVHVSSDLGNHILNGSKSYTAAPMSVNQTTYRDILAYLAGVTGTIAYFDRDGALDMRWFNPVPVVPSEYKSVEYIESTGTQYIDIGIKANQKTGFDIVYYTNNELSGSTGYGSIFGARQGSASREYQLSTYSAGNAAGIFRYGTQTFNDPGIQKQVKQKISVRNGVITSTGGVKTTLNAQTFDTPVNLSLFALHQNQTYIQHGSVRIYEFKLYDGDSLIAHMIPCYRISDSVIGMYDLVRKSFFTNGGSGTFTKGNDLTYPVFTIDSDILGNGVLNIDVADYAVTPIDALEVLSFDVDLNTTVGSGSNIYALSGNPFVVASTPEDVGTLVTPIYNRLAALSAYNPISMRYITDWSLEAGDIINVVRNGQTITFPIMQQIMDWKGGFVISDMQSSGDAERQTQEPNTRAEYRDAVQMHEFNNTANELLSRIQDLSGNFSLIQQTINSIEQTVSSQGNTIQTILDPTGQIWTAIKTNATNLSTVEAALNDEVSERKSYIRFIPAEPAIVIGVDSGNEIKLKLVNNIIYFFNGDDDSTDLSLAYAYFNSEEAGADRFVATESVQIGNSDSSNRWLWKMLSNGDLVLDLI